MGKSFRSGHSFPASAGFTNSSGKVRSIKPYTRSVPKAKIGTTGPVGAFARTSAPMPGAPPRKPKLAAPAIPAPLGHALVHRAKPVTQQDALHGGTGPLRPGFKKGGPVGTC